MAYALLCFSLYKVYHITIQIAIVILHKNFNALPMRIAKICFLVLTKSFLAALYDNSVND
jgi:hypothetical protein